jgi:hypothetical protein
MRRGGRSSSRTGIRKPSGACATVDDKNLSAAGFRHLARTVGADTQARTPVASALRQRVLARLAADAWYEDLVAKAERKRRRGKAARRQAKIARLLLGRSGRHWQPRVDNAALKSWLAQYRPHAGCLGDRIDPAWIVKLEGRVRRREIFWLCCYTLLIGGLLIQFVSLSVMATFKGQVEGPLWLLMLGPFLAPLDLQAAGDRAAEAFARASVCLGPPRARDLEPIDRKIIRPYRAC